MCFVYILFCLETDRNYAGQTSNLLRRYQMYVEGTTRFTRERFVRPVVLYWEAHPDRTTAMRRESYFKAGGGHRRKLKIIEETRSLFEADNAGMGK